MSTSTPTGFQMIFASKYKQSFSLVTNSKEFRDLLLNSALNDYKFEILSEKHRDEAINMCCVQLSKKGGSIPSIITNMSEKDGAARFVTEIDHAIKTRLSFIALHVPTKTIAFISTYFDVLDLPEISPEKCSLNLQKRTEFLSECFAKDEFRRFRMNINPVKPGEIVANAFCCINPAHRSKQRQLLAPICMLLQMLIFAGIDCIKQDSNLNVHPKTIMFNKLRTHLINSSDMNLHSVEYVCPINDILKRKMECDPWYQQNMNDTTMQHLLKKKYSFSYGSTFYNRDKDVNLLQSMMRWGFKIYPKILRAQLLAPKSLL